MSFFDIDYCRRCDINPVSHQEDYCDRCIEEMSKKQPCKHPTSKRYYYTATGIDMPYYVCLTCKAYQLEHPFPNSTIVPD